MENEFKEVKKTNSTKVILILLGVIIVIPLVVGLFFYFAVWPNMKNKISDSNKCSIATCSKCINGLAKCEYLSNQGINVDIECECTDIITELPEDYLRENFDNFLIGGSVNMSPLYKELLDVFGKDKTNYMDKSGALNKFYQKKVAVLLDIDPTDDLKESNRNLGMEIDKKEITKNALVFLVNKDNPVKSLTKSQIKDIYSGQITNWKEVGGDDALIKAFQSSTNSKEQKEMKKLMGDSKLLDRDIEYTNGFGSISENIHHYDGDKYSIGYSMYTFIHNSLEEKQSILLNIDEIIPNDDNIFDKKYPFTTTNNIYYDKNNKEASEFVNHLYTYLMSRDGQDLISNAGYINTNTKLTRNKVVDTSPGGSMVFEMDSNIDFYNYARNEFYAVGEYNNIVTYNTYQDYVLRNSKHKDNHNLNEYLKWIYELDLYTDYYDLDEEKGTILIDLSKSIDGSLDHIDLFIYKYNNKFYTSFYYNFLNNKFYLEGLETKDDKEMLDFYIIEAEKNKSEFKYFLDNYSKIAWDEKIELNKSELKLVSIMNIIDTSLNVKYSNPFE